MPFDRRRFLLATAALPAATAVPAAPAARAIDVRSLGARGDGRHDDSAAFQAAIDRGRPVWVPAGRYLVGELSLWSHTRITGTGPRSILVHRPGSAVLAYAPGCDFGSADPRDNVRDVALEDLAFHGRTVEEGFLETNHLLAVCGCSGLAVRRCTFRAFQGDAIYVAGSSYGSGRERHNEDIAVSDCVFDGVNFQNRQGVSITDGTRVAIRGNVFRDCSRFDMPGAVDIEPETPWARVRGVAVERNRFVNVMGGVGAICVILALDRYDEHPRGISIRANRIEGRFQTLGIVAKAFVDGARAPPLDVAIEDNTILDTFHGFEVSGVNGARVASNLIRGTIVAARLSVPNRGRAADVRVEGNRFEKVGMHSGVALEVHPTARLCITGNRFVDCGWSDGRRSTAIDASAETPGEMRLEGNVVREPRARTRT